MIDLQQSGVVYDHNNTPTVGYTCMHTCSIVFTQHVARPLAIPFLSPFSSPQRESSSPGSTRNPSAKGVSVFCSTTFCTDLLLSAFHFCGKLSLVGNLTLAIASTTTKFPFHWNRSRNICATPSRLQHWKTYRIPWQYKSWM